jgi:hypothetical protein
VSPLEEVLATAGTAVLLEQLEAALLRLVALAGQVLERLLAGHHLLAADDAVVLVLDQILLGQTAGRVLRSAMVHLGLGTNSDHLSHLIVTAAVFCEDGRCSEAKRGDSQLHRR